MNEYNTLAEFYPTPPELIARMLKGTKYSEIKSVLDPSAGKGDLITFFGYIMDFINDRAWRYYTADEKIKYYIDQYENDAEVSFDDFLGHLIREKIAGEYEKDCQKKDFRHSYYNGSDTNYHIKHTSAVIEINPTLQDILKARKFTLVGSDFLTYNGDEHYDLIIMNPPFSNGDEHLLKAIDLAKKTGGRIVCLLNAETIKNPYSNRRKLLIQQLEKYNAEYDYVKDGFKTAEHQTDVECVIVKLNVPSPFENCRSRIVDELEDFDIELDDVNSESHEIVTNDVMKQAVLMYKREIELGKRLIQEYLAIKPYITSTFNEKETPSYVKGSNLILSTDTERKNLDFNDYVRAVRYKYWYELLHKPSFMGNLTSNLRTEYFNQIKELSKKDFSLSNIYAVKIDILSKVATGIEKKIVNLFEKLSYEHSMGCDGNIHLFSGWKTNKAYIINSKVVVPYMHCWDSIWGKFKYDCYPGEVGDFLNDIQKCLDFLDGGETEVERDVVTWLKHYEEGQITKNLHFKYFDVNVYKKGTIHIKFTNPDVLKKLNIYGCLHKGWLPPVYGKKHYRDMTQEEKTVIDGFEGEQEYEKVFAEKDRYIVAPEKSMLMIESTTSGSEVA